MSLSFKHYVLFKVGRLYSTPDFTGENPTMDTSLIEPFYDVLIDLINELGIEEKDKSYIENTLLIKFDDADDLVRLLRVERNYPNRNDSRYRLGFRIVYFLLDNNIETLNDAYFDEIFFQLIPFFERYEDKELIKLRT